MAIRYADARTGMTFDNIAAGVVAGVIATLLVIAGQWIRGRLNNFELQLKLRIPRGSKVRVVVPIYRGREPDPLPDLPVLATDDATALAYIYEVLGRIGARPTYQFSGQGPSADEDMHTIAIGGPISNHEVRDMLWNQWPKFHLYGVEVKSQMNPKADKAVCSPAGFQFGDKPYFVSSPGQDEPAVIARVRNSISGRHTILIFGVGGRGTAGAARFVATGYRHLPWAATFFMVVFVNRDHEIVRSEVLETKPALHIGHRTDEDWWIGCEECGDRRSADKDFEDALRTLVKRARATPPD
jgi:hypothetical protein